MSVGAFHCGSASHRGMSTSSSGADTWMSRLPAVGVAAPSSLSRLATPAAEGAPVAAAPSSVSERDTLVPSSVGVWEAIGATARCE